MRKVSYAIAAALLLSAGNVFAAEVNPAVDNPNAKISTQIESLLEEHNGFNLGDVDEMYATVRFMLNEQKEIIVLTVDTQDERLERYVKARLNYEKVADQNLKVGKTYKIPIRVRS